MLSFVRCQRKGNLTGIHAHSTVALEPNLGSGIVHGCFQSGYLGQGKVRLIHIQNNVPVVAAEIIGTDTRDGYLLRSGKRAKRNQAKKQAHCQGKAHPKTHFFHTNCSSLIFLNPNGIVL